MDKKSDARLRILSTKDKKTIVKMYWDKGIGIAKIAKELKISLPVIKKVIVEMDERGLRTQEEVVALRARHTRVEFTKSDINKIVKMYKKGISIYKIKKEFNTSTVPIVRALIQGGIHKDEFRDWKMEPVRKMLTQENNR